MNKLLLGAGLLAASAAASAQEAAPPSDKTTVGVSLDVSVLLGIGLSVGTSLGDHFNARGLYHGYTYSKEIEDEGGNYDGEFKLSTFGAMFDYHPFEGAFRITAGLMSNGNKISLKGIASSTSEFEVGDCTYVSSASDPLFVNGNVDFNSTAPYLGFGWGGNMNAAPGFYGIFDIGVMLSGSPKADLNAGGSARAKTGQASSCGDSTTDRPVNQFPEFQQELADAENDANEESKDFKLWPNISFGIGWRF